MPVAERGPAESYRPDPTPPSFSAPHQPGIATPVLDHLAFAALDLAVARREEVRELVGAVTEAGERIMHGAAGTATVTLGLGPGVFGEAFGLRARRPVGLVELPAFAGDCLDPAVSGGDLGVQACATTADAAQAALGAVLGAAGDRARVRWSQPAAMQREPDDPPQGRPRNLLGFKDATSNPRRGKDLDRTVWTGRGDRTWMNGGTYLVVRRVRVRSEAWAALTDAEQERVIGRHRRSGAPLGEDHEFAPMPLDSRAVPPDAHARVAAAAGRAGATVLRRGYSYENRAGPGGEREAGLLLLLFCRDPRRQFVPLQRRLAAEDALTRFTETVGSALFAVPPGRGLAAGLLGP